MDVAFVIDVVGPDDVRVVELGDRAGFEAESLQVGRIVDAVLRQHLDRHPPLHELVLGQVDAAHAALADLAQQLVLAEAEALVLAGEQFVGLPRVMRFGLDQQLGQLGSGLRARPRRARRCRFLKKRGELGLVDEVASPQQVDQLIGGHLRHCAEKLYLESASHDGISHRRDAAPASRHRYVGRSATRGVVASQYCSAWNPSPSISPTNGAQRTNHTQSYNASLVA